MPPKAAKPTSDELLAQFDNLGVDQSEKASKPSPAPAAPAADNAKAAQEDILSELDHLAAQRPSSGPGTPRLSVDKTRSSTRSPRPSATIDRTSEDRTRQSGETGRSSRTGAKPEPAKQEPEDAQQQQQQQQEVVEGGGWWGGIFATASATATAAMKQAEAAVKEIQNNEEAQRWAQQMKGNVGALRDFGTYTLSSNHLNLHIPLILPPQAASFAAWQSQPSPTSSTPSHPPSPHTNASRSM